MQPKREQHWASSPTHTYSINVPPKALSEALSRLQTAARRYDQSVYDSDEEDFIMGSTYEIIELLLRETSRMRPVGNDGKHNDLHTDECGCEDKIRVELTIDTLPYLMDHSNCELTELLSFLKLDQRVMFRLIKGGYLSSNGRYVRYIKERQ